MLGRWFLAVVRRAPKLAHILCVIVSSGDGHQNPFVPCGKHVKTGRFNMVTFRFSLI